MSDPITAPLLVVRRLSSDKTHVMRVGSMTDATVFGASYKRPVDGWAECGVEITDGVVMRPGTKTRCVACRRLTGIQTQADNQESPL